jgi:hypothetical protein
LIRISSALDNDFSDPRPRGAHAFEKLKDDVPRSVLISSAAVDS